MGAAPSINERQVGDVTGQIALGLARGVGDKIKDDITGYFSHNKNTVKRTISSKSPIYIPLVLNLAFLFVVGSRYLYYYKERPTVEEFKKVFHPQKIDGSSSTGSSS